MPTPHKHAAVIKAWADGAEIQCKAPHHVRWQDCSFPAWNADTKYRVKPETKKYRVVLWKNGTIGVVNRPDAATICESSSNFDRWLTDWVEYECPTT